MSVSIGRPESDADWRAVRLLCCETGDAGSPVAEDRRPFFGEFWVGPYQLLCPGWTYVARDGGRIVGYLTGTPDTARFCVLRAVLHRLPLLAGVLFGRFDWTVDVVRFLQPWRRFAAASRIGLGPYLELAREYPAHLHVNVADTQRAAGVGRLLMDAYLADLRRAGVPGVHLLCGPGPVGYYEKQGFSRMAQVEIGGKPVFVFARKA